MWILVKVGISALAFFIRLFAKYINRTLYKKESFQNATYYQRTLSSKNKVALTSFGLTLKSQSLFKITRESSWDHFFKKLGLVDEIQTGDNEFDKTFYIASDCREFRNEIRTDTKTRQLLLQIFDAGCTSIRCDGETVWFHFPGNQAYNNPILVLLFSFRQQITAPAQHRQSLFSDPFSLEVLLIEALIWSFATYAVLGFLEWAVIKEDLHLDASRLVKHGIALGFFLFTVLLAFIVFRMNRSSRGHRVVVESFMILILSFPMAGIHLISDINTKRDRYPPHIIDAHVEDLQQKQHRGRRGRRYYTYHISIRPTTFNTEVELPREIKISRSLFNQLGRGHKIQLTIGRGALHHPWYKAIDPVR